MFFLNGLKTEASGDVFGGLFAVNVPESVVIYFLTERPGEPELRIEEGVRVQPLDFLKGSEWPPNTPRPDQVLCRSKIDPKFYKVFKYRFEIPAEFEDTGMAYGGIYDLVRYREIRGRVSSFRAARKAIGEMPHDPAETDEAWSEIFHNLGIDPAGGESTRR